MSFSSKSSHLPSVLQCLDLLCEEAFILFVKKVINSRFYVISILVTSQVFFFLFWGTDDRQMRSDQNIMKGDEPVTKSQSRTVKLRSPEHCPEEIFLHFFSRPLVLIDFRNCLRELAFMVCGFILNVVNKRKWSHYFPCRWNPIDPILRKVGLENLTPIEHIKCNADKEKQSITYLKNALYFAFYLF